MYLIIMNLDTVLTLIFVAVVLSRITSSVSAAEYDVVFYRIGTDGVSPVVEDVFRCVGAQTGNDTVSFQYTESGKEKKEDSIITRKSIVCARKVCRI